MSPQQNTNTPKVFQETSSNSQESSRVTYEDTTVSFYKLDNFFYRPALEIFN